MAADHELRLTLRACEELDVDCAQSIDDLVDEHQLIRAFVDMRTQQVTGQETTQLPRSSYVVFNLHAGRWRGLTWWDEATGVVWLLGGGFHRSGDRSDAYAVLKGRDVAGELFPTKEDYRRLGPSTPTAESFTKDLDESARSFVEEAIDEPGTEVRRCFGDVLDVRIKVTEDRLWIGLLLPPRLSGALPNGYHAAVLAALLPGIDMDEINFAPGVFPGAPHATFEPVVRAGGSSPGPRLLSVSRRARCDTLKTTLRSDVTSVPSSHATAHAFR